MTLEAFAVPFLVHDRSLPPATAAAAAAIFEAGSVVLSPLLGALADRDLAPPPLLSSPTFPVDDDENAKQDSQAQQKNRRWWCQPQQRTKRLPPGSLQLAASACGALGILLPILAPQTWPAGFLLISVGVATAGVAYWLALPLFAPPDGLGRAVGTALALNEAAILVLNVAVGALLDAGGKRSQGKGGGNRYRWGALPFLLGVAAVGTGLSAALLPRIRRALEEGMEEEGEGGRYEGK